MPNVTVDTHKLKRIYEPVMNGEQVAYVNHRSI